MIDFADVAKFNQGHGQVRAGSLPLRCCTKTSVGQAYFQQNDPHPDPLPTDGRGNSQNRPWQLPKRLDTPTDGGRFSLSHPMGEGRLPAATAAAQAGGEGASTSKLVFAR